MGSMLNTANIQEETGHKDIIHSIPRYISYIPWNAKSVKTIKKYQASCFNFSEGIVRVFDIKITIAKIAVAQWLVLVSTVVQ